jgi:hypothetical protein
MNSGGTAGPLLVILLMTSGAACKSESIIGDARLDHGIDDVPADASPDVEEEPCVVSGPVVLAPEVRLTDMEKRVGGPDLVWTGSEILMAWIYTWFEWTTNYSNVMLTRMEPDGTVIDEMVVAEGSWIEPPQLWWTGSGISIAWSQWGWDDGIWLSHLDPLGTPMETVNFPAGEGRWSMAWTGREFGIFKQVSSISTEEVNLAFQVIDIRGEPLTDEIPVAYPGETLESSAALTWTGESFALAWDGWVEGYTDGLFAGWISAARSSLNPPGSRT